MPNFQGERDGLCGMYAIVNAYEICLSDLVDKPEKKLDRIFRTACGALERKAWPKTLWQGTSFGEMRRMIFKCEKRMKFRKSGFAITVKYPFLKKPPRNTKEYWNRFTREFHKEGFCCAVIGVEKPVPHWVVVEPTIGGDILFSDSGGPDSKQVYRMDAHSIRGGKGGKIKVAFEEVIIFRRVFVV